ncbi:DUF2867 domain-containing protein [Maritalea porphyrae]|uniref:DUF2867 domain-containing protein n=1 Tax=Maritalea porphyrae TaxID=880732 RepID=UPI0022AF5F76|nr:DUF2867 domain-containing protein [Maritalea porphyrae]MCZ4271307.1 DUF2867 domain-containing protein [Maritalea porphyrae]
MAKPDQLPSDSTLQQYYSPGDFMDSYSSSLKGRPDLLDCDIRLLAEQIGNIEIDWAVNLLKLRNILMQPFRLKSTKDLMDNAQVPPLEKTIGDRVAFFKIYNISENEIILGEDDWHQDFRVSLYRTSAANPRVIMTTICKRHNAFGYAYLAAILPFHKLIVRSTLEAGIKKAITAT